MSRQMGELTLMLVAYFITMSASLTLAKDALVMFTQDMLKTDTTPWVMDSQLGDVYKPVKDIFHQDSNLQTG